MTTVTRTEALSLVATWTSLAAASREDLADAEQSVSRHRGAKGAETARVLARRWVADASQGVAHAQAWIAAWSAYANGGAFPANVTGYCAE